MTRRIINTVVFTTMLAASSLFAETRLATVSVPFSFRAGSETLPAGVYQISKTESGVLFLRSGGTSVALITVGSPSSVPAGSNLVRFEKIAGKNTLKEVLVDGGQGFILR